MDCSVHMSSLEYPYQKVDSTWQSDSRIGEPVHVLVVDDDEPIVEVLCLLLEDEGFRATGETSALGAIRSIRKDPPDVIITDVMMPGMSGLELARRALAIEPDTSILMMSAVVHHQARAHYPMIQKPFDFSTVVELVERQLQP